MSPFDSDDDDNDDNDDNDNNNNNKFCHNTACTRGLTRTDASQFTKNKSRE